MLLTPYMPLEGRASPKQGLWPFTAAQMQSCGAQRGSSVADCGNRALLQP